ncbi:MAG: complex I NDUFA9 subunit family protein [Thalassobaculales bacterium]
MALRLVTVFGGSGFIGRNLVGRLAKAGYRVNVAVRRAEQAKFLKPLGDVGQITPVPASLRDPASIARAVAGAWAVVNLVGILHESGRQRFHAIHAEGARQAALAAKAAGAQRFVQVSAIGADPASPAAYARSKAAGEAAVRAVFPEATILRPSLVFGPDDGLFNRFAAMARLAPALPLIGGGHTRFQPVYVGDVADAIMAALAGPGGGTYELGGPEVVTFREILELMMHHTGIRRPLVPVPWWVARLKGAMLQCLPSPPLTLDQVRMLERDNVVAPGAKGLADLGITPTPMAVVLPGYLERFRPGGRFSPKGQAA